MRSHVSGNSPDTRNTYVTAVTPLYLQPYIVTKGSVTRAVSGYSYGLFSCPFCDLADNIMAR